MAKANVPEYDERDPTVRRKIGKRFPTRRDEVNHHASKARGVQAEFSGGTLLDDDDESRRRGEDDPPSAPTACEPRRAVVDWWCSRRGRKKHAVSVVETGARATLNLWLTADARSARTNTSTESWRGDEAEALDALDALEAEARKQPERANTTLVIHNTSWRSVQKRG